jgi:hypothetical protein
MIVTGAKLINNRGDIDMEKGKKISDLRTRKRLEQQAIDVAKGKFDAAVKPVGPRGEDNVNANK